MECRHPYKDILWIVLQKKQNAPNFISSHH
ncbi:MAG: hypothetical protein JWP81_4413 [Ferruginibacter sp.]|nr:hypothetical protein [Ferruginibacter sp.]